MALIEWVTEPFTLGFQQRALIGGILAGLMCSVVGTWLVLRGMAFFGDAFTHGVVPGIAAAVAFNFSPLLGAAIAAAVMLAQPTPRRPPQGLVLGRLGPIGGIGWYNLGLAGMQRPPDAAHQTKAIRSRPLD